MRVFCVSGVVKLISRIQQPQICRETVGLDLKFSKTVKKFLEQNKCKQEEGAERGDLVGNWKVVMAVSCSAVSRTGSRRRSRENSE
jgi:hypothetical protein